MGELVDDATLKSWSFADGYSTSDNSLLNEFFVPALDRSERYDRAVGFFASSMLALAPVAFSEMVRRGGKIRLLCSPHLNEEDAQSLLDERTQRTDLEILADSILATLTGSDVQNGTTRAMRAMIEAGVLEIRFVVPETPGMFHDKVGLFRDRALDQVSFVGSANETAAAWSGFYNHEQFEVFKSWGSKDEADRIARHRTQFENLWLGLRRGLRVLPAVGSNAIIRKLVAAEPLDEILESIRRLLDGATAAPIDAIELRDYQAEVLVAWEAARHRGVVRFATGGGKTRTAIEAVRAWMAGGGAAVVVVPTAVLHSQWKSELETLLPDVHILPCGARSPKQRWLRGLRLHSEAQDPPRQQVVLTTAKTASSTDFLKRLAGGAHLLLVADEVHTLGAPDLRRSVLSIDAGAVLGLSATPERYGDPEGTQALRDYFGDDLEPTFDLVDAIKRQVLVPYDYEFRTCSLTDDEQEGWDAYTAAIGKELARNDGRMTEECRILLRNRARVLKGAAAKPQLARQLLEQEYERGDRWLIYCSDIAQVKATRQELEGLGIDLLEYHTRVKGDLSAVLSYFTMRGGVILAVKCLDEGVDIPGINKALILASSTNPREYIQRRGRVLRRAPNKFSARIYDAIVLGPDGLALSQSEIVRAIEFASGARNLAPEAQLEQLLDKDSDLRLHLQFDIEE